MYHRRSIKEWLRGDTMDSDELLWLLENLPEASAFKTWAQRGGEWPAELIIQTRIANEMMASRADGTGAQPDWIKTPGDLQAEENHARLRREIYEQGQDEMRGRTRTRRKVVNDVADRS